MKYCWGCMAEINDDDVICPYCGYDNGQIVEPTYFLKVGTMLGNRFIVGRVLSKADLESHI